MRRAATVAVALALTACPAETPRNPPTASPTIAPSGIARVAVPEQPATLNPLTTAGLATSTRHLIPLVTPVIWAGRDGPGFVHASSTHAGTRKTRVAVEPGSTWSNGVPITAADIARTWRLVRAAKIPFEGFEDLTDVRLTDDGDAIVSYVNTFTFAHGFRVLPPDFDAKTYARAWPVSGGPFILTRWTSGLKIAYAENPTSPGGRAHLAGLDVTFVPDPDAALALFHRGAIDVLTRFGAPAWHERMARAGAKVSMPGNGQTVALVMRAPPTALARRRMLARIDLARLNSVLVQGEAAVRCDTDPTLGPCGKNPPLPAPGPKVSDLRLAFESSDALAGQLAVALRRMLGPLRLQPRVGDDLWTHLDETDLLLVTAAGRDDLATLDVAGRGTTPRVFTLFVARASLGARQTLDGPGYGGPFDGAAAWPSAVAKA